jgi:sugar-specific transcriptional regulator TrmB
MKELLELGLTEKEIDVYIAILRGKSSTKEILKAVKISRNGLNEILKKMLSQGFVSSIEKNNKISYQASDPTVFLNMLKEKESIIKNIIPELMKIKSSSQEKIRVRLLSGKNGIKIIMDEIIESKETVYSIAGDRNVFEYLKYYLVHLMKQREKHKIPIKLVLYESARKEAPEILVSEKRYLPEEYMPPITIDIFGDNTNIIVISESPFVISITSKAIAESFRKYFKIIWEIAKK